MLIIIGKLLGSLSVSFGSFKVGESEPASVSLTLVHSQSDVAVMQFPGTLPEPPPTNPSPPAPRMITFVGQPEAGSYHIAGG